MRQKTGSEINVEGGESEARGEGSKLSVRTLFEGVSITLFEGRDAKKRRLLAGGEAGIGVGRYGP